MKGSYVKAIGFGVLVSSVAAGCAAVTRSGSVQDVVRDAYRQSDIELDDARRQGEVVRKGTVFALNADNVPANRLRVIPAVIQSSKPFLRIPPRHAHTYVPVLVHGDTVVPQEAGELTLPRGTRLVVLERKVGRDRIRLLTHTAEPIRRSDGTMVYGCTEFIFEVKGSDATAVQRQIERVLAPAA